MDVPFSDRRIEVRTERQILPGNVHSKAVAYIQNLVFFSLSFITIILLQMTFWWFHKGKMKPQVGMEFLVWEKQLEMPGQCFFITGLKLIWKNWFIFQQIWVCYIKVSFLNWNNQNWNSRMSHFCKNFDRTPETSQEWQCSSLDCPKICSNVFLKNMYQMLLLRL